MFAADGPVRPRDIASAYADVLGKDPPSEKRVAKAVGHLNRSYRANEHVFRIEEWGEGYRMATVPSVAPFLNFFFNRGRERRLSRSLMETLAIVVYRQPVTKPEVDFVRGVDAGYALSRLMERGLVDVVGRSDSLGRPLIYGTTKSFLEQFGLKSIDDLPTLREIREILDDPTFSRERAELLQLRREEKAGSGPSPEAGSGSEAPHPGS